MHVVTPRTGGTQGTIIIMAYLIWSEIFCVARIHADAWRPGVLCHSTLPNLDGGAHM